MIPDCQEKPLARDRESVPQTDTGRRGENPQANERTPVKELGKLTPYLRKKGCPGRVKGERPEPERAAEKGPKRLFTKNTGLCEGASRSIGADACPMPEG